MGRNKNKQFKYPKTACVKITSTPETIQKAKSQFVKIYSGSDVLSSFSINDICKVALDVNIYLVSRNDTLTNDNTLFEGLQENLMGTTLNFYMRDASNLQTFARLQHCIEEIKEESIPELQSWILHYGGTFILGTAHLSMGESIQRMYNSLQLCKDD